MLSRESPHVRESKIVLESGFNALGSRFHDTTITGSMSVELGFRILIVSGILDSLSCISDSKNQDFIFHRKKSATFQISQAKIPQIPESGFPYMGNIVLFFC